jgi:hypothetical protein
MSVTEEPTITREDGGGYAAHEHRPLAAYAALSTGLTAAFAAATAAAARRRGGLPESYRMRDLALAGIATHKISRTLAKEKVTSWVRAPFTRFQEPAGFGELDEQPRGTGMQRAIGELLVCPYCLGHWVASAFGVGLIGAPRTTRLVAFVFTAETIADFLQLAYKQTIDEVGA